jgi:hypothetical protein
MPSVKGINGMYVSSSGYHSLYVYVSVCTCICGMFCPLDLEFFNKIIVYGLLAVQRSVNAMTRVKNFALGLRLLL